MQRLIAIAVMKLDTRLTKVLRDPRVVLRHARCCEIFDDVADQPPLMAPEHRRPMRRELARVFAMRAACKRNPRACDPVPAR